MFKVDFWIRGGHRYPARTSNPNTLVENITKRWAEKGYQVQTPLLPDYYPAVYEAFSNGKKTATMTIRRMDDEQQQRTS